MTRRRGGPELRLTREEWGRLSERMRGEDVGGWIMSSQWQRHGSQDPPCVAITTDPHDGRILTIFLAHIIEVTHEPYISVGETLEDLRYLADQTRTFLPGGFVYPTYYLPCVTAEGGIE